MAYFCGNRECERKKIAASELSVGADARPRCPACGAFPESVPDKDDSSPIGTGIAGGAVGGIVGAIFGPLGIAIGAAVGAALGADAEASTRPTRPKSVGGIYYSPTEVHNKTAAFISFAVEDARSRDLFVGQSRHPNCNWDVADHSLHEPFSERWKSQARARIARSHVVIQLIGAGTARAEGAVWEVRCGHELGIPAFGVRIFKEQDHQVPSCFSAKNVVRWERKAIAEMIKEAREYRDEQRQN